MSWRLEGGLAILDTWNQEYFLEYKHIGYIYPIYLYFPRQVSSLAHLCAPSMRVAPDTSKARSTSLLIDNCC